MSKELLHSILGHCIQNEDIMGQRKELSFIESHSQEKR
jgi:hypothetical protein